MRWYLHLNSAKTQVYINMQSFAVLYSPNIICAILVFHS